MTMLIVTRTLKIVAVLVIEMLIFGIGKIYDSLDKTDAFAKGIDFMIFTAILVWLVW